MGYGPSPRIFVGGGGETPVKLDSVRGGRGADARGDQPWDDAFVPDWDV